MISTRAFISELWGTFILVFIGCGSVALAILYGMPGGIYSIAALWGVGVALAIYSAKNVGPAHLNPAVSVAIWLYKPYPLRDLLGYIVFQFMGAMLAGLAIYLIFFEQFMIFEFDHEIVRGSAESAQTSKIFGEFYHDPERLDEPPLSTFGAVLAEAVGTFMLALTIFILMQSKRMKQGFIPVLIGLTVAVLIVFIAPYTQAGLNPARDFGPRLIAFWAGWGEAAFPPVAYGFFTVYIFAPIMGGVLAAIVAKWWFYRR